MPEDNVALFEKIIVMMGDVDGKISLEQYKNCVKKNPLFFQSLGLIYDNESEFSISQLNIAKKGTSSSPPLPPLPLLLFSFSPNFNSHSWKKGLSITFGHRDWMLVQNMMMGIRRVVGEASTLPSREIKQKDYEVAVEIELAR